VNIRTLQTKVCEQLLREMISTPPHVMLERFAAEEKQRLVRDKAAEDHRVLKEVSQSPTTIFCAPNSHSCLFLQMHPPPPPLPSPLFLLYLNLCMITHYLHS
jgi:hypothetical protein